MSSTIPFAPHFHDERVAYAFVEAQLWPDGPVCPHCGSVARGGKLNGKSTRPGLYKCYECRKPFTVKLGTPFQSSNVKLHIWLRAMHLLCSGKNRAGSSRLSENLGVTGKTAWSIRHRIRDALRRATMPALLLAAITHDRPPTPRNANKLKRPARTPRPWSIPWNMTRNPFTPLPTISKLQNTTSWAIKGIGALE